MAKAAATSTGACPTHPQHLPLRRPVPVGAERSDLCGEAECKVRGRGATQRASSSALRRKALLEGVEAMADGELLHLVLCHPGAHPSAGWYSTGFLLEAGGLRRIGRVSPQGLVASRGMPAATAVLLAAALELGRRNLCAELGGERPSCGSFDAVVAWARPRLGALEHEEFWVLGLDGGNFLKTLRCVARGGQHGCALTTLDILRPALTDGATALVVVHNHPSGDPTPSEDDTHMTRALAAACEVVGTPLLDHVIITRTDATSLLELGILD